MEYFMTAGRRSISGDEALTQAVLPETFFGDKNLVPTFLYLFNHIQVSIPLSPVLACYSRIRRTQCYRRSFGRPGQPPDQRYAAPAAIREAHLAKKALRMRLPISPHHLNPLKNQSLRPADYELHTPDKHAPSASTTWPVL
jgi:hypothetical protein